MRTPVSLRAADLDAEYFKKVVSVGKALHKLITDSPRLVEFLEKLEKQSSRSSASISSMVDSKDIELVLNQTQELNKLGAPDLPLLNTQAAIEKIAGVTKGTVAGGQLSWTVCSKQAINGKTQSRSWKRPRTRPPILRPRTLRRRKPLTPSASRWRNWLEILSSR